MDSEGVRNRRLGQEVDRAEEEVAESLNTLSSTGTLTPSNSSENAQRPDEVESFEAGSSRLPSRGTLFSQANVDQEEAYNYQNDDRFKRKTVEETTDGFPRYAAFTVSDQSTRICRSFSEMRWRRIQHVQTELTELEKDLCELDKADFSNKKRQHRLRRTLHKDKWDTKQQVLFRKIDNKFKQYDDLVFGEAKFQAFEKTPARNHRSVWYWIKSNKPLTTGYYDFIFHDDFVNIAENRTSCFEEYLLNHLNHWPISMIMTLFSTEAEKSKTNDGRVTYYSDYLLDLFARFLVVSMAVAILLLPVYILFLVPMSRPMMAVTVTSFLLPFSIILSAVCEKKRSFEVFIGTATYGSVLVMFLGNISQAGSP